MRPYRRMMILLVCMIATGVILQGVFDASDHAKSERIVRSYQGAGGVPLGTRVEQASPDGAWTTEILSSCRGYVRVRYIAPKREYIFDYDVPQHHIHPGNPAAAEILRNIPAETSPPAAQ